MAQADAAYMTFLAQHRTSLHSTNPIERVNGEVKRRTDVMGMGPGLGRVDKLNPDADGGKQHECGEALGQFVVAGGDPT